MAGPLFLATTALTALTGFLFAISPFTPALGVGVASLAALAAAILGLYILGLVGSWRWIYVAGAVLALYLNVFVAIVQAVRKLAFLQALAPTQSEPPFVVSQLVVMALVVLGVLAVVRFRPGADLAGDPRTPISAPRKITS